MIDFEKVGETVEVARREACLDANRSITFEAPKAEKKGTRPIAGIAATGEAFEHPWWGPMVLELETLKLARKGKIPFLWAHDTHRILGKITGSKVDGNDYQVSAVMSESVEGAKDIIALADSMDYEFQMSISVDSMDVTYLKADESMKVNGQMMRGPLAIWSNILVDEISLCAIGACPGTLATFAGGGDPKKVTARILQMSKPADKGSTETPATSAENPQPKAAETTAPPPDALALERKRVESIQKATPKGMEAMALDFVAKGTSVEDALTQFSTEATKRLGELQAENDRLKKLEKVETSTTPTVAATPSATTPTNGKANAYLDEKRFDKREFETMKSIDAYRAANPKATIQEAMEECGV